MSMQSEGNDAKGRNYDQATKNGSGSAGSMGVGGTGDVEGMGTDTDGSQQSATRTDDLLTDGSDAAQDGGFLGEGAGDQAGELQTGMAGIGSLSTGNAGNRQAARQDDPAKERDERNGTDGEGYAGSSAGANPILKDEQRKD